MIPDAFRTVRLTDALHRLIDFYDSWGKPEQAAAWRKRLAEAEASVPKPKSEEGSGQAAVGGNKP